MAGLWNNKYSGMVEPKEIFTVLIAAAGSGQRMGGVYKPLSKVAGEPMLAYSLRAFQNCGFVKQIVVSAPEDRMKEIMQLGRLYEITKLYAVVQGGETRADSVVNAFKAAFNKKENITPFLAIHDAARPMITPEMLNKLFFECVRHGSAVCATRLRDAIKKAGNDQFATDILDREGIWQMQTPQAFDTDIYHTALATLGKDNISNAHDDAAIVMKAGFKCFLVETGFSNFKVTYPEDLELAELILRSRKEAQNG
ncbi:MAG: 2-C-methyl-D-erythritol 4-phosphate cytidylyltransferase [Clostridia bacterium]|nr:2-C-methyl-D-erythritol 4-phosphate cytidylyltransferase [Clostridia bacterium]